MTHYTMIDVQFAFYGFLWLVLLLAALSVDIKRLGLLGLSDNAMLQSKAYEKQKKFSGKYC